jgi:mutator protein MutT
MCTIAILLGVTEYPLVLAANRDELYTRPTRPPERLAPGIAGGVDEVSGGTWLAIDVRGRFAAVTNQRVSAPPTGQVRSRGLLVRELALAADPDAYVAAIDPRMYASMNLAWGGADGAHVAYLRHEGSKDIVQLGRGIHVLCNDRLGSSAFPRAERFARDIAPSLRAPWPELSAQLQRRLGDHTELIADSPLSATCIHTPVYGTRSATIAAFSAGRVVHYDHAEGPPCTTPFRDLMALFRSRMPDRDPVDARARKLVVAGLVVRDDGRVLISQRRADQALPLQWEFPGGKVEAGESPTAALARELEEELGITVEVGRIWDVVFHAYDAFDLVMLVYRCRLVGDTQPRAVEVADFAWSAPAELSAWDILQADRPLVERLVREGASVF